MGRRRAVDFVSLAGLLGASAPWRITALKLLDGLIGRWLVQGIAASPMPAPPVAPHRLRQILLMRPGGIGDAVLVLPLIEALHHRYPQAAIDVLAERRNADIFLSAGAAIRRCWTYDRQMLQTWRQLRTQRYDLMIDTEQWHYLSGWLTHRLQAPIRMGFDTNRLRRRCYTLPVAYDEDGYEGENFMRFLSALGGEVSMAWDRPWLSVDASLQAWADAILEGRRPVALAPSGGIPERTWPLPRVRQTVQALIEQGDDVCLLGDRGARQESRRISGGLPSRRLIDLTGRTSLRQAAAILSQCRMFIGPDSGLMHVAAAVGAPVVALFGASIASKWAPLGSQHRVLTRHLPCSPCTCCYGITPRCALAVQCLWDIRAEEVMDAAARLMERA